MGLRKELVTLLELQPHWSIPHLPKSARSWPLQSWAKYVESRPSLHIDLTRLLTFVVHGDVYPCPCGCWTQVSIGLIGLGVLGGQNG